MANAFLAPSPVAPLFLLITGITNAVNAQVTVSTDNEYVVGQLATFLVPSTYGMFQISGLTGQILTVDSSNLIFTVAIDTTQFDTFVIPMTYQVQPATMTSGGSRNLYNTTTIPFHSINGSIGN